MDDQEQERIRRARVRAIYQHQGYFNYSQASRYTGLSIATLRRRVKENKLKVIRNGVRILIEIDAIDAMLHAEDEQQEPRSY